MVVHDSIDVLGLWCLILHVRVVFMATFLIMLEQTREIHSLDGDTGSSFLVDPCLLFR